jgi:hypothetical protein
VPGEAAGTMRVWRLDGGFRAVKPARARREKVARDNSQPRSGNTPDNTAAGRCPDYSRIPGKNASEGESAISARACFGGPVGRQTTFRTKARPASKAKNIALPRK